MQRIGEFTKWDSLEELQERLAEAAEYISSRGLTDDTVFCNRFMNIAQGLTTDYWNRCKLLAPWAIKEIVADMARSRPELDEPYTQMRINQ